MESERQPGQGYFHKLCAVGEALFVASPTLVWIDRILLQKTVVNESEI